MQIDSGMSSHGYSARPYMAERKTDEAQQATTDARKRSLTGLTGSSTLLSSSLASALWAVEGGREDDTTNGASTLSLSQVETVYSEF